MIYTPIIVPLDKTHRIEVSRHVEGIGIVQQHLIKSSTAEIWREQSNWGLCLDRSYMLEIASAIQKLARDE